MQLGALPTLSPIPLARSHDPEWRYALPTYRQTPVPQAHATSFGIGEFSLFVNNGPRALRVLSFMTLLFIPNHSQMVLVTLILDEKPLLMAL